MELINYDGRKFIFVPIRGDGNCMFSAISYCMCNSTDLGLTIRQEVVELVLKNWMEWGCMTSDSFGVPYVNKCVYRASMIKSGTYGDAAELFAAASLLHYTIHVLVLNGCNARLYQTINPGASSEIFLAFDLANKHYSALELFNDASGSESRDSDFLNADIGRGNDCDVEDNYVNQPDDLNENVTCDIISGNNCNDAASCVSDNLSESQHPSYGSSRARQTPTEAPPGVITSKPSMALTFGEITKHYMWAKVYKGETASDIQLVSMGQYNARCLNQECGALYWQAEHLYGSASEVPFWCCGRSVKTVLSDRGVLKPIRDPDIHQLYFSDSPEADHFRRHIRAYNMALSTAIPITNESNPTLAAKKIVTVNGMVYRKAPSFPNIEDDGYPRHHGQLYFLDFNEQVVDRRMRATTDPHLRREVLAKLELYLRQHNDLVRTFEFARDVQREMESVDAGDSAHVSVIVNPHRTGFRTTDRNLFIEDQNIRRPVDSDSVAAVVVGSEIRYNYDVVFHLRNRSEDDPTFMTINEASPTLDMMMFPLIHLHGEDPWVEVKIPSRRKRQHDGDQVVSIETGTLRQYYSARLMTNPDIDSGLLFRCRGLYQQWLIDAACKIMDHNLRYAKEHQTELQVCQYDSLQKYVRSVAEKQGRQPGRIFIMPANEQRSERNFHKSYLDSVTISIKFGAPSLFLTFSMNPRWPEVVEMLRRRGLKPDEYMHAPDAIVRIFLARVKIFLSDVINKSIFGRVIAWVGVTEFTTSMMPHYHLIVVLHPADRPGKDTDEIDALVCAEIPDKETEPELHHLVMSLMTHRPCDGSSPGYANPYCRQGSDKCKHGFPKAFQERTTCTQRGVILRRRPGTQYYHRLYGCYIDNRWTVEYNPKALMRYKNHLNIKICWENIFFKYLFGYVQKEAKGAHMQGSMLKYATDSEGNIMNWDEIEHFLSMRYIGAYEAVYRILGVALIEMSHSVVALPIHLPDKQFVHYRGTAEQAADKIPNSKLLAWFRLNERCSEAREFLYHEIVSDFKWEDGEWKPKTRGTALGRLMTVNPSSRTPELFHLRLLLLHIRGATDFTCLLTVDGFVHVLFEDACRALGLTSGDCLAYDQALAEVITHASPWQIRLFFATLVAQCTPPNVEELWMTYRQWMAEDFARSLPPLDALSHTRDHVLRIIGQVSTAVMTSTAVRFTLPGLGGVEYSTPDTPQERPVDRQDNIQEFLDQPANDGHISSLNEDQRALFDAVMQSVTNGNRDVSNIFSLMAPAGSGKTHVYLSILTECKRRNINFVATGFTAIAALLLLDGETCHRAFGIPIKARCDGTDRSFIEASSPEGMTLKAAKIVLIDESSMLAKWQIQLIDRLFRMLEDKPQVPFGGKTILIGGDMAQILPVMKQTYAGDIIDHSIVAYEHWCERQPFTLSKNMRAAADPAFAEWVAKVRDGSANIGSDTICVPEEILIRAKPSGKKKKDIRQRDPTEEDRLMAALIDWVFGSMTPRDLEKGVILSPVNETVRKLNKLILDRMPGTCTNHFAVTTAIVDGEDVGLSAGFLVTQEELNAASPSNLPPHVLRLKPGCIVMLLLNMNKKQGLCNGTRFVVTGIGKNTLRLKRLVPFKGCRDEIFVPKLRMRSDDLAIAGSIERYQFPVCLAAAITINKSQGQTISRLGLFLRRSVFTHGQFYVAVSRPPGFKDLRIAVLNGPFQGVRRINSGGRRRLGVITRNIVIRSIVQ